MSTLKRLQKIWGDLEKVDFLSGIHVIEVLFVKNVCGPYDRLLQSAIVAAKHRIIQLSSGPTSVLAGFRALADLLVCFPLRIMIAEILPTIVGTILFCVSLIWPLIYFPIRAFMNFCLHDLPWRPSYTPSAQLRHSDKPYQSLKNVKNGSYSWDKALRRAISWLFMGALVGAAVFAGLYFGGAPLLILSSGFYEAMAGASAAAFVGLMMYSDVLRDTPNNSHKSRFFYYLRTVTASCLMAPLMVLGAKLLPALYGVSKSFTVAESLLGSTQVHFMLKSLMGIACGIMFVGQSLSMMFIALSHRAEHKGWTYFNAKRLRIAGKMVSVLFTLGLAGIATNVIPLVKGAWTAAIAGSVQVSHAVVMGAGLLSAALLGFWRYAVVRDRKRAIQAAAQKEQEALDAEVERKVQEENTIRDTAARLIKYVIKEDLYDHGFPLHTPHAREQQLITYRYITGNTKAVKGTKPQGKLFFAKGDKTIQHSIDNLIGERNPIYGYHTNPQITQRENLNKLAGIDFDKNPDSAIAALKDDARKAIIMNQSDDLEKNNPIAHLCSLVITQLAVAEALINYLKKTCTSFIQNASEPEEVLHQITMQIMQTHAEHLGRWVRLQSTGKNDVYILFKTDASLKKMIVQAIKALREGTDFAPASSQGAALNAIEQHCTPAASEPNNATQTTDTPTSSSSENSDDEWTTDSEGNAPDGNTGLEVKGSGPAESGMFARTNEATPSRPSVAAAEQPSEATTPTKLAEKAMANMRSPQFWDKKQLGQNNDLNTTIEDQAADEAFQTVFTLGNRADSDIEA